MRNQSRTNQSSARRKRSWNLALLAVVALAAFPASLVKAFPIVVGHDINTLGSTVAGTNEATFAVNVASYLTAGSATKNLLLFESNPGDGTRNFAPGVLSALSGAGFSVTVTPNYSTPFSGFDAIFVAQDFPVLGFLNNTTLIDYVNNSGGVYLAGGVGPSAANESAGWSTFLNSFGLDFVSSAYNGLNNVAITSGHPIFAGVSSLNSGNGQSILDLGTNPNATIVQFAGNQGVYAVVNAPRPMVTPEPTTAALLALGLLGACYARRRAR